MAEQLEDEAIHQNDRILITRDQAKGYMVKAYSLNTLCYDKWSDDSRDTTAMINEALEAMNRVEKENHQKKPSGG